MNDQELIIEEDEEPNFGSGYHYNFITSVITPESAEEGEESENDIDKRDSETIDDLVSSLSGYGWGEGNYHREPKELAFVTIDPDRDMYDGSETYYTVFIKKDSGEDFSEEEMDYIRKGLGMKKFNKKLSQEDVSDFNQRTAWVAQALMALIKYGPVVLEIIRSLRDLVSDKEEVPVTAMDYSDYREAGFVDDVFDAVKSLPSQIPDILSNPSTQEFIAKKFNMDISTVKFICDLLKRIADSVFNNPDESEKEKEEVKTSEEPEVSSSKNIPTGESKITPAGKYTSVPSAVATQINSNSFVLREGSDELLELEDRVIALAKMYNIKEVEDLEIEISKEGEVLSIRRKEAMPFGDIGIKPDLGLGIGESGFLSLVSGKLINPEASWGARGESALAGAIGGPLGGLGYNVGLKFGHEYMGFLAGLVLQSVLNATLLKNDPKVDETAKKNADANVSDTKKQSYNYYLAMKDVNPANKSIKLVKDKMASDKVDEETAFWRLVHDKSSEIVKAMEEAA
jgi:hypothetical protein